VVHAAAESQVVACEKQPRRSLAINVVVPERLAGICAQRRIDFLFTSTDLVFDGRRAPYEEGDPTTPVCEYARQKAAAEAAVLERCPQALVCRMPLMFGLAPNTRRHFTVQMLTAIASGRPMRLFVDEFRSPVDTASAAAGILAVLGKARGLLHLGGRTRVSRYDLGCLVAGALGLEPAMLEPTAIDDLELAVRRSPDCTLVSERAYGLGYAPQPLEEAVRSVVNDFVESAGRF
jgi:dTDP-4-dehydrorhamnose reductase